MSNQKKRRNTTGLLSSQVGDPKAIWQYVYKNKILGTIVL